VARVRSGRRHWSRGGGAIEEKWDESELSASRDLIAIKEGWFPLGTGGTFGEVNREGKPSGFVRVVELKGGPAFYAQLRLPNGRRIQRRLGWVWSKRSRPPAGYLTRAQAEARLQAILSGQDESVPIKPKRGSEATFGMAAAEWMRYVEHDRKRRPSTVQDYRRELAQRLIPEFGADTPLTEITTDRIEEFREKMVGEGRLSPRTINKRLQQLHSVFRRAQRVFGLQINPVANAERQPFKRSGDFRALAPSEVALLAANADNDQDAALFEIAAFTGLRLGELRGLRWSDVDWMHRLVHVRRSYTRHEVGPTKSGKVRSVPLVDQAARALDRLSRREHFIGEDDLVFVNAVGEAIEESAMRRRFYRALKRAGLEHVRFHDLRHTFGTIAVQAFPLTDVKAFMGHADIQTTMVYVHHVPQNDAADKLSRLLDERMSDKVGCEMGAKSGTGEEDADPETTAKQEEADAGGGTRTPDTRIMIPLL
jgi:integrase